MEESPPACCNEGCQEMYARYASLHERHTALTDTLMEAYARMKSRTPVEPQAVEDDLVVPEVLLKCRLEDE